jgi:hypothetical protein
MQIIRAASRPNSFLRIRIWIFLKWQKDLIEALALYHAL